MGIIDVKELTKKYRDFTAVDGISFTVGTGEIFGILGPNGAGKTTTLEMIEGLKLITAGTVILDGHNVSEQTHLVKSLIGVQLQSSTFFDGLTLKELLETFGWLYGREIDALELLREVQLQDKANNQVKELSGGQKQRLSIAAALVNDPKILFLDEPTTGLDPQARRNMWELITRIHERGKTIVLTTHYMEEAEVLCNRVAIMDNAKIIALDTPMNLLKNTDVGSTIEFHVDTPVELSKLQALPAVDTVTNEDHSYTLISSNPEQTLPSLFQLEGQYGFHIFNMRLRQATLEDVFLKLTGRFLRE